MSGSEAPLWARLLDRDGDPNVQQAKRDLESGRLRALPAEESVRCGVAGVMRDALVEAARRGQFRERECDRGAVVFDPTLGIHQCPGCALSAASQRAPVVPWEGEGLPHIL